MSIFARLKEMKKNKKKGFTLVELIVVLVILAILAAVMIPALLGYIDKAKLRGYTVKAEAVLVAAQATLSENYALGKGREIYQSDITNLTSIGDNNWSAQFKTEKQDNKDKDSYKITEFSFKDNSKGGTWVNWTSATGEWVLNTNPINQTAIKPGERP